MASLYDLPTPLKDDGLTLICGEHVGTGASRTVYLYEPNPTNTVVKVETTRGWHQNAKEWAVWHSVKEHKKLKLWFAPCIRMSDLCVFLLQERTHPVTLRELKKELPKVPQIFTDLKAGNWGRTEAGRIVCHDYGNCLATETGMTCRLKTANWWTE